MGKRLSSHHLYYVLSFVFCYSNYVLTSQAWNLLSTKAGSWHRLTDRCRLGIGGAVACGFRALREQPNAAIGRHAARPQQLPTCALISSIAHPTLFAKAEKNPSFSQCRPQRSRIPIETWSSSQSRIDRLASSTTPPPTTQTNPP